jgi:hypothetical protein
MRSRSNSRLAVTLCSPLILLSGVAFGGDQTFNASDSFTVPDGVSKITVEAWGGGGAGGGSTEPTALSLQVARAGAGGGGGGYASAEITVTPSANLAVTVGAGGTAATGANGGAGGDSTIVGFAGQILAQGGFGGTGNTSGGTPAGGAGGGAGSVGTTTVAGVNGVNGETGPDSDSGAGGAGGNGGGAGGASITNPLSTAAGNSGSSPGGAGGGSRSIYSLFFNNNRAGGAGAAGRVRLTWAEPGVPVADNSEVAADPASVFANGESASTITVTVKNAYDDGITGLAETDFAFSGAGAAQIGDFSEVGNGVYAFAATNTTAETVDISVTVSTVAIGSTGSIEFKPAPDPVTSSVVASASVVIVGSETTVTVTVLDSESSPIAGLEVTLTPDPVANVTIDAPNPARTDATGVATFTVGSTVAQTVKFTASYNPDIGAVDIEFQDAPPPQPTAIPTMSVYGLSAMTGLLALLAGWQQRRRR